ncbi:hypothetical protein QVD99_002486 [Batrachochytrium dendrobatidis]|nr:hypothetical protein O5D80_006714 [Batrachochytrium dendrobatidis]KAK5670710.1 hypothetical protein QVD99_002486 [Batrachochytrium dendrobatidis]
MIHLDSYNESATAFQPDQPATQDKKVAMIASPNLNAKLLQKSHDSFLFDVNAYQAFQTHQTAHSERIHIDLQDSQNLSNKGHHALPLQNITQLCQSMMVENQAGYANEFISPRCRFSENMHPALIQPTASHANLFCHLQVHSDNDSATLSPDNTQQLDLYDDINGLWIYINNKTLEKFAFACSDEFSNATFLPHLSEILYGTKTLPNTHVAVIAQSYTS